MSRVYQAESESHRRQLIKTSVGSFNTIVTRITVKNQRDYDLRVCFTVDERHVPVLMTATFRRDRFALNWPGRKLWGPRRECRFPDSGNSANEYDSANPQRSPRPRLSLRRQLRH